MKQKEIMNVHIIFNGPVVQLEGKNCAVCMIPFEGTVTGERFQGVVEPCGVDTQITNAANVRSMSARYMLSGKDDQGKDAHIYVENNGWFDDLTRVKGTPFQTVPTFYTDSESLAPYLHCRQFLGEGRMEEDGLHIRFFEL